MKPIYKFIITIIAIIIGAWVGAFIGMIFTSDRQELDALTGGLYGAPAGAAIGLLLSWYFVVRHKRNI
jgi:O-antigen/teichoic acid export membrane protein